MLLKIQLFNQAGGGEWVESVYTWIAIMSYNSASSEMNKITRQVNIKALKKHIELMLQKVEKMCEEVHEIAEFTAENFNDPEEESENMQLFSGIAEYQYDVEDNEIDYSSERCFERNLKIYKQNGQVFLHVSDEIKAYEIKQAYWVFASKSGGGLICFKTPTCEIPNRYFWFAWRDSGRVQLVIQVDNKPPPENTKLGVGFTSFETLSALSNPYAVPRKNPENNQSQSAQKKSSAR